MSANPDFIIVEQAGRNLPVAGRRFVWLRVLGWVLLGLLVTRSYYLQVVQGGVLQLQAEGNRVTVVPVLAPRGIVYDNYGEPLLANTSSIDVVVDPLLLPDEGQLAELTDNLSENLSLARADVRRSLERAQLSGQVTVVVQAVPHDQAIRLEGMMDSLPGVRMVASSVRNYHYPDQMAHLLGYTGAVTEADLAEYDNLLLTETTGKSGVEKYYDETLRGRAGATFVEVDVHGKEKRYVDEEAPSPGADLHLTVDGELQRFIFDLLAGLDPTQSAAVVALDPRSGAVRALVNYPSFNPNVFSQPALRDQAQSYFEDAEQPLFNRAVGGTYPPGSTIKPLLAAGALEEGTISSKTVVPSTGGISIGQWHFPDWKAGGHGPTDVTKAIAESVNTFFYVLIGGDREREGLGVERAKTYLEAFSWGTPTGIDVPGEATGFLPSPRWKQAAKGERWYVGDTYHLGIGQGDVLVTPLQVATATAAIANGGTVYTPYVLERAMDGDRVVWQHAAAGFELPVQDEHVQTVQAGMREAVVSGSAVRLSSLPLPVAGKTGTAQFGSEKETHAWFVSYGPMVEPELLIALLLEKGGQGDEAAVPVAQEIWQWWAEHRMGG